jgi:hypothetical protein
MAWRVAGIAQCDQRMGLCDLCLFSLRCQLRELQRHLWRAGGGDRFPHLALFIGLYFAPWCRAERRACRPAQAGRPEFTLPEFRLSAFIPQYHLPAQRQV